MNKAKIKSFAIWAREKLISDIKDKARLLGILDTRILSPLPTSTADLLFFDIGTSNFAEVTGKQIHQREELIKAIKEKQMDNFTYSESLDYIIEEVAYTWFNRLIAIRFMEINDYLPSGIRVLSSINSLKLEPDIVTTPFDSDLIFSPYEKDKIVQFKDENKLDELFRLLFIKQCNKLSEILPELFERTDDYTELLLTISFIDVDGIVYHLVHDIDENDFNVDKEGQVEIIGWLYQYYISTKHEQIINIHKGTISKTDIPAATQLFTTDWVVRYMVDNSLGRYWIERNPNSNLQGKLKYLIVPKSGNFPTIKEKISPTELSFFDPCMGSGHILVYAFDVLMEIYRECGYTDKEAAINIVENNLYGLDIDKRAYQLAYFAIMMKAKSYNSRILNKKLKINITYLEESNNLLDENGYNIPDIFSKNEITNYLLNVYENAQEIGSLKIIKSQDYQQYYDFLTSSKPDNNLDLFTSESYESTKSFLMQLTKQAQIMSKKYDIVCTNPPYMNKYEGALKDFIYNNFADYKGDLFSAFMYRNFNYCKDNGYSSFMTPNVWMFIQTYKKLREYIISEKSLVSLIQMAKGAFFKEATVDVCTFVLKNAKSTDLGAYIRLENFKGDMDVQNEKVLEALSSPNCNYYYETNIEKFKIIPGMPFAYWTNNLVLNSFESNKPLGEFAEIVSGMTTGNNDKYMRDWKEVNFNNIAIGQSTLSDVDLSKTYWFPYNKGGPFRRWYGNNDFVVNWSKSNEFNRAKTTMTHLYLKPCITWSDITSAYFSARACDKGFFFDVQGSCAFPDIDTYYPFIAFLNSKIAMMYIKLLNPTLHTQVGDLRRIPFNPTAYNDEIIEATKDCISIAKSDYDSFETSWDFSKSPLLEYPNETLIENALHKWSHECDSRFNRLKINEKKINQFFINLYKMEDHLDSDVDDKYISVHLSNRETDIKDFISYSVGCMFGRYSIDKPGLQYAGGEWNIDNYASFIPDEDNCIPITDEDYFKDDIVGYFVKFVETLFGKNTLEENLNFIAKTLGVKGKTSRDVLRNYFLNDFIKDHIKKYQKRPIYWLFDSGKNNGFKAIVYMHRWNEDTVGNLRVDYLHKIQRVYDKEIQRMSEIIELSSDNKEISYSTKRKEKLTKQLKETTDYDALLSHIALSRIGINLDDGVKINYEKVQTTPDKKKLQILFKM